MKSDTIEKEIKDADVKLTENTRAINDTKLELEELERVLTRKKQEVALFEEKIRQLLESKDAVETSLHDLNEETKKAKNKKDEAVVSLKKIETDLDTLKNDYKVQQENAEKALKAAIEPLVEEKNRLEKEVTGATKEVTKARDTIVHLGEQIAIKTEEKAIVTEEAKKKQAELTAIEKKVAEAIKRQETAENAAKQANLARSNEEETLVSTREEIKTLQAQKDTLVKEISDLEKAAEEAEVTYQGKVSKLFAISSREEHVKQQEAHIREVFAKANVPYPEFSE